MPRSKREKVVSLTKVKKRSRAEKLETVEALQECANEHTFTYLFRIENMKNESLKTVRNFWRGNGRFFMGKNKLMTFALGREPSTECKPNIYQLTQRITGNSCGLFFTNAKPAEVLKYFAEFEEPHFARSGFVATEDFGLVAGHLEGQPFSIEPQLRALGLPTRLKDGQVILESDVSVCKVGDVLTPEQCKVLKLFGNEMAVFRIKIDCVHTDSAVTDLTDATPESVANMGASAGAAKSKKAASASASVSDEKKAKKAAISMSASASSAKQIPKSGAAADFAGAQFMLEDGTEVVDWNDGGAAPASKKKSAKKSAAAAMEDEDGADSKADEKAPKKKTAAKGKGKKTTKLSANAVQLKEKKEDLNTPLPFEFDAASAGTAAPASASASTSASGSGLDLGLSAGIRAPRSKTPTKSAAKRSASKSGKSDKKKKANDDGMGTGKMKSTRKSRVAPMLG